jgi:glycosyltransferase involved in cell wall biosynthesis
MDTSQLEEYVTKAYLTVLGRSPDPGGLNSWMLKIRSGNIKKENLAEALKVAGVLAGEIVAGEINGGLAANTSQTQRSTNNKTINFYPVAVPKSGYGILGENIYKTLVGYGYKISQSISYNLPPADISLHLSIPPSWRHLESTVNIGYTMFEASRIPDSWVPFCNCMDRLIVPLGANINVFRLCGVTIPIDVVPIGVDETIFNPEFACRSSLPSSSLVTSGYKFLIVNDGQSRKNNEMVVKAFQDEFRKEIPEHKVFLVTRTPGGYQGNNVLWIEKYLEDPDLACLIKSCDCVIGASCGEAGDIPVLEGMAMEKPVIVSRDMAHPEYITDGENGIFIKTERIVPAFSHSQYKGLPYLVGLHDATWTLPSYESLKKKMRYVYENRDASEKIGKNAREYILKYRTLKVCIQKMIQIFEEYGI